MAKIQARVGSTLADTYDARGGIAGLEDLRTPEVALVHEMGGTIQSERFSSFIRRGTTGDLGQSLGWEVLFENLPAGVTRLLGVTVFADVSARTERASVLLRDPLAGGGREIPIWIWDQATGIFRVVRMDIEGSVASVPVLSPVEPNPYIPTLLVHNDQPQSVGEIAFRGQTTAFGAGTVEHVILLHIAFAAIGGLSSRGLPIPSW